MNISSVVDCLLAIGACDTPPGARAHGLGSLEEQEELSGDLRDAKSLFFILARFFFFLFSFEIEELTCAGN